jgi:hypothetical protein
VKKDPPERDIRGQHEQVTNFYRPTPGTRCILSGDNSSRPVELLLERLEGVREHGSFYRAFCPAHDDRTTPNLDVKEGDDGRALLICRAGCRVEDVVEALGLEMRDLFAGGAGRGEGGVIPPKPAATLQPCTLETYAEAKNLPVEFLKRLGLSGVTYSGSPAVRIPYKGRDGAETAVRFRLALEKDPDADNRFRWRRGSKPSPYGLWRLEQIEKAGYVYLVEGESDCHTLWHHGLPALGVPGASNWRNEWAVELAGVEKVYAVVEPDRGGEAFWERLAASPLRERLYRAELEGAKDASELHLADPERFRERIEQAREGAVAWLEMAESEEQGRIREAWSACEPMALAPDILSLFEEELRRGGFAGEARAARVLFLALVSRLLTRIVSVAVKGPSSGGKSYLVEQVLRFFPEDAYHALTAMSDRTLAYSEEPIRHRFLVVYEAEGMSGEFATYLLRSLLSEGRLRYETVEKTRDGMKPRLIEREGPTGLIVTTTAVKLHPENETRLLSITVSDTREQTRDILAALAEEDATGTDLAPWRALQEWLASSAAERRVTIPYARALAGQIPPVAVRLRRDFAAVLGLVRAHAVLHQATRERDEGGRIVATLEDYASVRDLVADLVSDGVEATVPASVKLTVRTVGRLLEDSEGDPVTVAAVSRELKLDKSAALRRVRTALDRGHLRNLEDRKGRPARLVLGDPIPEDVEILPSPERLEGCRVAVHSGGIIPPSTPATDAPDENEGEGGSGVSPNGHATPQSQGDGRERFTI